MSRKELKIGMSLWCVYAYPEDGISIEEYIIRSIKRPARKLYHWTRNTPNTMSKEAHLVAKINDLTWGKRSSKNGDYGWLTSIPDYCRFKIDLERYEKSGLPCNLSFTKSGAYHIALVDAKNTLKEYQADPSPDDDYIKLYKKMISSLKGLYTKSKKK